MKENKKGARRTLVEREKREETREKKEKMKENAKRKMTRIS